MHLSKIKKTLMQYQLAQFKYFFVGLEQSYLIDTFSVLLTVVTLVFFILDIIKFVFYFVCQADFFYIRKLIN